MMCKVHILCENRFIFKLSSRAPITQILIILSLTILTLQKPNHIHAKSMIKQLNNEVLSLEELQSFLAAHEVEAAILYNYAMTSKWNSETHLDQPELLALLKEQYQQYALFKKDFLNNTLSSVDPSGYGDESLERQIAKLKELGIFTLGDDDLASFISATAAIIQNQNEAAICSYVNRSRCDQINQNLRYYPDVQNIMANSVNYQELLYTWEQWHAKTATANEFATYFELINVAASENGYVDAAEMLKAQFEEPDLTATVDRLWQEMKPLYEELHSYVAFKLYEEYGKKYETVSSSIPAHLLGHISGESWRHLYERLKPFEGTSLRDAEIFLQENYSIEGMFTDADNFYQNLGLPPSYMSYNSSAIIQNPVIEVVNCHPSAWDFFQNEDYRIKMCSNLNLTDYSTVHRVMGRIVSSILYKDQPFTFRNAINPLFKEVFGDVITLSATTPKHLHMNGLLRSYNDTYEDNMNSLFLMALDRVAYLPFGLFMDKWRWEVFSGSISQELWNARWWKLREEYQKVTPPLSRTASSFDAGGIYQEFESSNFMANFMGHILQFQIHKALCKEIGQYEADDENKRLHNCDIAGSSRAGEILRLGMIQGGSKHWSDVLELMTGERNITTDAILEYFDPLYKYLREVNSHNRIYVFEGNAVAALVGCLMGGIAILIVFGCTVHFFYSRGRKNKYSHI